MTIRAGHSASRPARTFYEVAQRFAGYAAVRVLPETGRTHQIRVHLLSIHHPILCDKLYGGRDKITMGELRGAAGPRPCGPAGAASTAATAAAAALDSMPDEHVILARQALHARRLRFRHPKTGQPLDFTAPLPRDIQETLSALEHYRPWRR